MAVAEAATAFVIFSSYSSTSPKFTAYAKNLNSVRLAFSSSCPSLSVKFPLLSRKPSCPIRSAVEAEVAVEQEAEAEAEVAVEAEAEAEATQKTERRRKLFVLNLPWSLTVEDIKKLFGECGDVSDVEIIKEKDGKNRGFAFVTMASAEHAHAAIEKFDSHELLGRIIRVEYAKRFKKPRPAGPVDPARLEARHKVYVSNLAWKARSNDLREFFSANFNLVSARVVFNSLLGRSAGYGFVTFSSKEEAEAAISALDGKELLGRPIRLKLSEKNVNELEEQKTKEQMEDS